MNQNNLNLLAQEWFEKGSHDIDEARLSFQQDGWTDIICFHCQQTAEKYLKGFLVSKGINIGKMKKFQIHDLTKLWSECHKLDQTFSLIEEDCIILNPYYIEPRYPLGPPKVYTKEEAKEAILSAERIMGHVLNLGG